MDKVTGMMIRATQPFQIRASQVTRAFLVGLLAASVSCNNGFASASGVTQASPTQETSQSFLERPTRLWLPAPTPIDTSDAGATAGYEGILVASQGVDISSEIAGRLEKVTVRLGDKVSRHQILAHLNLQKMRAEIVVAEAKFDAAKVAEQRYGVAVSEAKSRLAGEQWLFEAGSIPGRNVETADYELKKVAVQREEAMAQRTVQSAELARLKIQLDLARIKAPFAGLIADRYLDPGSYVSSGMPIFRITSCALVFRFGIPPSKIDSVHFDRSVEIRLQSVTQPITGMVRRVAPEIDPALQVIVIEAELATTQCDQPALRPGLTGVATFLDREKKPQNEEL